ncbi:hypothetical protein [Salaquimonas pukyongi]|uniref:hypothetical protein n=1 Tax=Salaquimonas pukyongi TaxID=2712698 RepID=UPI00096B82DC|nr:hypothetical protein [Salaquimonas pukyongi]
MFKFYAGLCVGYALCIVTLAFSGARNLILEFAHQMPSSFLLMAATIGCLVWVLFLGWVFATAHTHHKEIQQKLHTR